LREKASGYAAFKPETQRKTPSSRRNRRQRHVDVGAQIMFGRLKDWRRVATRYDRCPVVFLSAVALAATVLFWL
jgi:transposase